MNDCNQPIAPKLKFKVSDIVKYRNQYFKIIVADVKIKDTLSGTRNIIRYEVLDLISGEKTFFLGEHAQQLQSHGSVITAMEILVKLGIDIREDL